MVAFGGNDDNRHRRVGGELVTGGNRVSIDSQVQRALLGIGGGEGDGAWDLLVLHLYRDSRDLEVNGHREGVGVSAALNRCYPYSIEVRIRDAGLRTAGNHLVAFGGNGGNRHLRAGGELGTGG